ncbi:MAG: hypothetical protein EA426_11220 [Spirochaetaceae bacterium]|nr:MAG: hypothetical protein EA426_11220 [Spirochaetaceae bacterium]
MDFDVCNYHFFASDIAVAMQAVLWTEPTGVARDRERWRFVFGNFMRGYRQEKDRLDLWRNGILNDVAVVPADWTPVEERE